MNNDINSFMKSLVEIKISVPDDFLKIKETLTRIGIASKQNKKLYQSCHILHKRGHYFLIHFKELFTLDGKVSSMSFEDIARRNTIAKLLDQWGLIEILTPENVETPTCPINKIKILPYVEKEQWDLIAKYNIGKK